MRKPSRIAGFDLETTGVDPHQARIVTATAGVLDTDNQWVAQTWLLKQDQPIPAQAVAVHGIPTGLANRLGTGHDQTVCEIAARLAALWAEGLMVAGHNIAYDLTVLDAELRRAGRDGLTVGGLVFDTLVADKWADQYRRGPGAHKLGRAWAHWSGGETIQDAHTAAGDAHTAAALALILCLQLPVDVQINQWMGTQYRRQAEKLAAYWRGNGRGPDADQITYQWPIQEQPATPLLPAGDPT